MINYLLKKYETEQAIAKYDGTISQYLQPASKGPQQYADEQFAKYWMLAEVYDESILNDAFLEEVVQSIQHSWQNYWAKNPRADSTDIAFQVKSLFAIQNRSGRQQIAKKPPNTSGKPYFKKP